MNLVIDVGNTRLKYGLFEGEELMYRGVGSENLKRFLCDAGKLNIFLTGSGVIPQDLREELKRRANVYLDAEREGLRIPMRIAYKTPTTLGFDRIATCTAAAHVFDGDLLVIDMGTCITYNYVFHGEFAGGNIAPGMSMRFQALHDYTAKLPLLEVQEYVPGDLIGKTTKEAMENGVMMGVRMELDGYIARFKRDYPEGRIFVTGGDAELLLGGDERVCCDPHLGLRGLNVILACNIFDD